MHELEDPETLERYVQLNGTLHNIRNDTHHNRPTISTLFRYNTGDDDEDAHDKSQGTRDVKRLSPAPFRPGVIRASASAALASSPIYAHNRQIYPDHSYQVSIMFLHQTERTSKYFWNRMAQWWTDSDIIHVELYFDHDLTTCTVNADRRVRFVKNKIYEHKNDADRKWERIQLTLSAAVYDALYQFCRHHEDDAFDAWGIYCFFAIRWQRNCTCATDEDPLDKQRKWICSRFVATALKYAGVFAKDLDEYTLTPEDLLDLLKHDMKETQRQQYNATHTALIGRTPPIKLKVAPAVIVQNP